MTPRQATAFALLLIASCTTLALAFPHSKKLSPPQKLALLGLVVTFVTFILLIFFR